MLCSFSEKEALSYRIWNPKPNKVVESRNVTFIEAPPHLIPHSIRLSPLQELAPVKLDNDNALNDDLLRVAWDYTVVFDFNVKIPVEHANVENVDGVPEIERLLRQLRDVTRMDFLISQVSSGDSSSVEPRPGNVCPGEHCRRHDHFIWRRHPRRASGAAQRTFNNAPPYRSATARRDTQQHNQLGSAFREECTAQLAVSRPLHQR